MRVLYSLLNRSISSMGFINTGDRKFNEETRALALVSLSDFPPSSVYKSHI